MLSLKDRIELLERDLKSTPPAFTMSRELPFAIFRYDPNHTGEGEWKIRREVNYLATKVHVLALSTLFWKSIEESEGLEAIVELEKQRGYVVAEQQVNTYLSDSDWRPLTQLLAAETANLDPGQDIMFMTRAAVFAPAAYRISILLEQIKGKVKIPSVLFYPGTWSGSLNFLGLRQDEEPLGSYRVKIYGRE